MAKKKLKRITRYEFLELIKSGTDPLSGFEVEGVISIVQMLRNSANKPLILTECKFSRLRSVEVGLTGNATFRKCIFDLIDLADTDSLTVDFEECFTFDLHLGGRVNKFSFQGISLKVNLNEIDISENRNHSFEIQSEIEDFFMYDSVVACKMDISLVQPSTAVSKIELKIQNSFIKALEVFSQSSLSSLSFRSVEFDNLVIHDGRYSLLSFDAITVSNLFSLKGQIDRVNLSSIRTSNPIQSDLRETNIKKGTRHSFRFLKNEAIRQNDNVSALRYHVKEMYSLLPNLWKERRYTLVIQQIMNLISNDHGSNWIVGLTFTVFASFFWYNCFNWSIDYSCLCKPDYWINFIHFFNPAHKIETLLNSCANLTFWAGVWDTLGRVFLIYGSYQTAQAFRSLGKK